MNIDNFITQNQIQPADTIIVKSISFGLFDHYVVYIGVRNGEHKFIANLTKGIRILTDAEIVKYSQDFAPHRINRFRGNQIQRNTALNRALSRKDENSYHLILNNCEHYANYVQTGTAYSQQTTVFGGSMLLTGLVTAAASKNATARGMGLFAAAIGLITLLVDEKKK